MKEVIAKHLLTINAVSLSPNEPFTWTSGIKSPIYCDNRMTLSYPEVRRDIAQGLSQIIKEKFSDVDVIAGTATAGIPHAAWVSEILDLPMAYIRGSAKGHGKQNQIEGKIEKGQKVVIVEDLISTGGSVITSAEAVRAVGAEVVGVVAIFTYELEKAANNFAEAELTTEVLTNYSTLVDVAKQFERITEEEWTKLVQWRKDPTSEAWMTI
ncbi:orotate phosphoribosyltransferase [Halalkalibacter urbisdiaboli]|uniref:orotate phosphoribosyltransferase n=1 Tax=Halalkalibacter urbisdiaboli TaxID=1960589 RepID=UPI000B440054|nr:orotate phosphoribosyltransferase [Halalkalibacter urbisdiaboli]